MADRWYEGPGGHEPPPPPLISPGLLRSLCVVLMVELILIVGGHLAWQLAH